MQSVPSDKFVSMIGFAKRARRIVYGFDTLKDAKGLKLLAVSDTASENLKTSMRDLADNKGIALVTAKELENIVGANCKALGITDAGMAQAMLDCAKRGGRYSL